MDSLRSPLAGLGEGRPGPDEGGTPGGDRSLVGWHEPPATRRHLEHVPVDGGDPRHLLVQGHPWAGAARLRRGVRQPWWSDPRPFARRGPFSRPPGRGGGEPGQGTTALLSAAVDPRELGREVDVITDPVDHAADGELPAQHDELLGAQVVAGPGSPPARREVDQRQAGLADRVDVQPVQTHGRLRGSRR